MWRSVSILLCTCLGTILCTTVPSTAEEDDPILLELQQISKLRKKMHSPKEGKESSTISAKPVKNAPHNTLSDYRFQERKWRIFSKKREENPPLPEPKTASDTGAVTYYSPPKVKLAWKGDPQSYLALKKIVDPMPEKYAQTYLKMKTLLNPTRKYVQVHIDKSRQRMWVYLDNEYVGDWKVSTARRGYWTPVGIYRPYTLHRMHYSRKYHHSPMPWSVFFKGGYAIHGTNAIRRLGRPASHGCVRVHPRNAKKLYQLIKRYGKRNTRIIIRG